MSLRCSLELSECYLRHRLDLAKAEAPNVDLRGTFLESGLSARWLKVNHSLNLPKLLCNSGLRLASARIVQLNCEGATFTNDHGRAVFASQLAVGGSLRLNSATVTGELVLLGARIGGQLNCEEATFTNEHGPAVSAPYSAVEAGVSLSRATVTGELCLAGARIGQLECEGATFTNDHGRAVFASQLAVGGSLRLNSATVTGELVLLGARIGGQLNCEEGGDLHQRARPSRGHVPDVGEHR